MLICRTRWGLIYDNGGLFESLVQSRSREIGSFHYSWVIYPSSVISFWLKIFFDWFCICRVFRVHSETRTLANMQAEFSVRPNQYGRRPISWNFTFWETSYGYIQINFLGTLTSKNLILMLFFRYFLVLTQVISKCVASLTEGLALTSFNIDIGKEIFTFLFP